MGSMTLYEISNVYREAAEKLGDLELPPEAVADTLEGLSGDLQVKATNVAMFCQNLDALAAQIKEAEAKMAHRRKVLENRAESIREYIKRCMESAQISKIECPYFKMSIKKNPPKVEIFDVDEIPDTYMRIPDPPPPAPDKKAIADALKAGQEVPGSRLEYSTRLEIK